jgi:hypothetical protein
MELQTIPGYPGPAFAFDVRADLSTTSRIRFRDESFQPAALALVLHPRRIAAATPSNVPRR